MNPHAFLLPMLLSVGLHAGLLASAWAPWHSGTPHSPRRTVLTLHLQPARPPGNPVRQPPVERSRPPTPSAPGAVPVVAPAPPTVAPRKTPAELKAGSRASVPAVSAASRPAAMENAREWEDHPLAEPPERLPEREPGAVASVAEELPNETSAEPDLPLAGSTPQFPPPEQRPAAGQAPRSDPRAQSPLAPGEVGERTPARALRLEKPVYPRLARRRGQQGSVTLSVRVLADGRLRDIRVLRSSGYPRLDAAALEALRNSRFAPARAGGNPVTAEKQVRFTFRLDSGAP